MEITQTSTSKKPKLGGGYAWWVWIIVLVFVLYLFNVQTMFSIVQTNIQERLHLSIQQLTLIAGVYTWAFAIFQFFGGAFLDSFGARKVLIPAFFLVTIGVFIYGISKSYEGLILAQIVMALGACVGFVGAGYIGGVWFGMAAYGVMFGYIETGSSISSAVQQPITNWIMSHMDYNEFFVRFGFFGVLLIILCIIFVKDPIPVKPKGNPFSEVFKDLWQVIKFPQIWIAAIWGGVAFGLQLAIGVVWAPTMVNNALGGGDIPTWMGGLGSALCWAGLGIGSLFFPRWSNKTNNRKIPSFIGMTVALICLLLVIFVKLPFFVIMICMFLIGLGCTAEMVSFMVGSDEVGGPLIGTSAAFINAFMFIIGGILQNLPSSYLKHGHTAYEMRHEMFWPFIIAVVIALILILIQRETAKKQQNQKSDNKQISPIAVAAGPAQAGAVAVGHSYVAPLDVKNIVNSACPDNQKVNTISKDNSTIKVSLDDVKKDYGQLDEDINKFDADIKNKDSEIKKEDDELK